MTIALGPSRKFLTLVALILLLGLLMVPPASAAEGRGGDRVVIGANEVIDDDLYVGAEELIIDGTVKGDVLAFAGSVIINGTVEGDLMSVAQVIIINGTVGDDVRIAGQSLVLGEGGKVGGDIVAFGFSFEARPESNIGGDLWAGLYQGRLAGDVAGDVAGDTGGLEIAGRVGGNVEVEVGDPEEAPPFPFTRFMPALPGGVVIPNVRQGLTISEGAEIAGELKYTSRAEGNIASGAVAGPITRQEPEVEEPEEVPSPGVAFLTWLINQIRRFIRLLAVGLLLVWLTPGWLRRTADALRAKPWPSLGWGALSPLALLGILIAVVIVVLLFALLLKFVIGSATLITMLLTSAAGTLTVAYLLFLFYIGALVTGFTLGELVLERVKADLVTSRIWPMAVGVILVFLLTVIPVLGALVGLVLALFGLGAIWLAARQGLAAATPAVEPVAGD